MEIEVVKKEKNTLMLRVEGESHTLANLLCHKLNQEESVKVASYTVDHPLKGTLLLYLKTDGKSPEKVMASVAESIAKEFQNLKKEIQSSLKRS